MDSGAVAICVSEYTVSLLGKGPIKIPPQPAFRYWRLSVLVCILVFTTFPFSNGCFHYTISESAFSCRTDPWV